MMASEAFCSWLHRPEALCRWLHVCRSSELPRSACSDQYNPSVSGAVVVWEWLRWGQHGHRVQNRTTTTTTTTTTGCRWYSALSRRLSALAAGHRLLPRTCLPRTIYLILYHCIYAFMLPYVTACIFLSFTSLSACWLRLTTSNKRKCYVMLCYACVHFSFFF